MTSGECGVYEFTPADERLFKNVRVVCKATEGESPAYRRKFIAGLNKSGYWVPLVAWENAILSKVMNYILQPRIVDNGKSVDVTQPPLICTPTIRFHDLAGAMNFMWARYAFGQVVLDNDIQAPRLDEERY